LSILSASACALRRRTDLPLHSKASPAAGHAAAAQRRLAQPACDECGDRRPYGPPGHARRPDRPRQIAVADHIARGVGRDLAVLHPAPVRGRILAAERDLELLPGRLARQLVLLPAAPAAMAHREHRLAPRPPSMQPNPELSPAGMPRRESGVASGSAG